MVEPEIRSVYSTGGATRVAFTKNGDNLVVAGAHGISRIYEVEEEDAEPQTLDILEEVSDLAVFGDDIFAVSSISGEVALYSIDENESKGIIIRSGLPVRSIAFTHNGTMVAAGGDDEEVQIAKNTSRVLKFKPGDQVHDLSYNSSVDLIALSLSNGDIKIYSLTSEEPRLVHTISGEIPRLIYQDDDEDAEDNILTARVEWSPNGDEFAIPSDTRSIKVYSRSQDFKQVYSLPRVHESKLVDLKWSPGGDYLASADLNNRLIIWDASTRDNVIDENLPQKITNISWSKNSKNGYDLATGSENGDIFYFKNVVKEKSKATQGGSLLDHIAASEAAESDDEGEDEERQIERALALDSENEDGEADDINALSDVSNEEGEGNEQLRDFLADDDGFIDDDDGAGYVVPQKRSLDDLIDDEDENRLDRPSRKSFALSAANSVPSTRKYRHKPYSPGCTPYISDRRYLTINSIGYVSSVKQETFASVTVSFFDQSVHREYHFDDLFGYDLAALTEQGILLGVSNINKKGAKILFRPHDSINDSFEKSIPTREGEIITSISLSDSIISIGSSHGYLRTFNLFGVPLGIQKTSPIIASATNSNYIFTISLSNNNQLIYNLQDLNGRFVQRDLALPLDLSLDLDLLKGIFFSSHGDPVIVGNDDVVLVLSRWRNPLQARWIPILDSELKIKEMGGKGELSIWPLSLSRQNMTCIFIRGSQYPSYPLPLPSELEVRLPISEGETDTDKAEEELVRSKTLGELLGETLTNEGEVYEDDNDVLSEYAIIHDKAILKLFSQACIEERNGKALGLAQELKQDKALAASTKIAERVGLISLVNRINKLREQRMDNELES